MDKPRFLPACLRTLPGLLALLASGVGNAGYPEARTAIQRFDYRLAYEQCIAAAYAGDADCQNAIGYLLRNGFGMRRDTEGALRWFRLAAQKNSANAQYNLALIHSSGESGKRDEAEATRWLLMAAENGNATAQANLGTSYATGSGVAASSERAYHWWKKAAEQGNEMAQNNLGWALLHGQGAAPDAAAARGWLDKAAAQQAEPEAQALARRNLAELEQGRAAGGTAASFALEIAANRPDADGKINISIASVGNEAVRSLKVAGKELGSSASGRYSVTRYIPIGESTISIQALSESGKVFANHYIVEREGKGGGQASLPELDPSRIVPARPRDAVAVIIGAEHYESLPGADFADHDARRFYDYAHKALGVPESRIKVLSGDAARRSDILLALRHWLAAEVGEGTTDVFFFYSGHGLASPDGRRRYLLPIDAKVDLLEDTAISSEQLVAMLEARRPRSVTMLIDSCYSGMSRSGATLLAAARPIAIHSETEELPSNMTVISSAAGNQISVSSAEVGHGLFSYFLMKGLEGDADQNRDGRIGSQELHAYVAERVAREALRRGVRQTPTLSAPADSILAAK